MAAHLDLAQKHTAIVAAVFNARAVVVLAAAVAVLSWPRTWP